MSSNPAFAFTPLVEPSGSVVETPLTADQASMFYILGQCCALTYTQMDENSIQPSDFSSFALAGSYAGWTLSAANLQPLTRFEATVSGAIAGDVGDFFVVQAGFCVQLTLTPPGGGSASTVTVIALRGTRTWDEWMTDLQVFPAVFGQSPEHPIEGLGSVHANMFADYTVGINGATVAAIDALSSTPGNRASGSLAQQVADYVTGLSGTSLYVTGHSLGAGLAGLCALDIAYNFLSGMDSTLTSVTLASPLIATGITGIVTLGSQELLVQNFQRYVPNSYQIANACDIVPVLPPPRVVIGPMTLTSVPVAVTTISFCAQLGDISANHGCVSAYVPYLRQLAEGFTQAG